MYIEVKRVVLKIESQPLDLEKINNMLEIAQEYDFCDVEVSLDEISTEFDLCFKQNRTSVFVDQWAKFWMRRFGVEFTLDFNMPENGKKLETSYVPAF